MCAAIQGEMCAGVGGAPGLPYVTKCPEWGAAFAALELRRSLT